MQEVFIYLLVAAALFFIGKRVYDQVVHKKKPGCADCGSGLKDLQDLQDKK